MTTLNHQFRLAARPVGLPKRTDWNYTEEPVRAPNDGEVLVKIALPLARSGDARLDERRASRTSRRCGIGEVMRAGGVGEVLESRHPGFTKGDHVYGTRRHPGVCDRRRQGPDASRLAARAAAGVSRHARHAGHDRVLRPARSRQAAAGPDGRRLRRGRRGRHGGRADREDQRLPRRRHRRRSREVRLHRARARLRRRDRLQVGGREGRRCASIARKASTCTSTTSAARFSTSCSRSSRARAHRDLRRDLPVQQHDRRARTGELHVAAGEPREHDRHAGVRLRRSLSRSACARWRAGSPPASSRPARTSSRVSRLSRRRC